jgi:DNA-binding transcriptional MerR regulator
MVILSAAITNKSGKTLLARQFVELNKVRMEGLLAAFPKLMGPEKEHTFIETENVRYVYQPLESLYILLVTNKSSNIMEDLETLHLIAKIVPEFCRALDEKEVLKFAFDLIFAFDEVIAMGYKERVNLQQIKHFLAMESNDEQRAKQEEKNKIIAVKKAADKKRKELEKKRLEDKRSGIDSHSTSSFSSSKSSYSNDPVVELRRESPKPEQKVVGGKGMQLSKGKGNKTDYSKVLQEENILDTSNVPSKGAISAPINDNIPNNSKVHTSISEKITLVAENDGGLKTMQVKGELSLNIFDPNLTKVKVHISQGTNDGFQFMTHPNMNKTLFTSDNILALKDSSKSFPTVTPTGILKWRFQTNDEKFVPLSINVWPSTSGKETTVPIQFEKHCEFDLHDITITIPVPGSSGPIINEIIGSSEYDAKKGLLHWKIPLIDKSSPSGNMEFMVPAASATSFFPVHVNFKSEVTFCAIEVVAITDEKDQATDFTHDTSLGVDQYDIE